MVRGFNHLVSGSHLFGHLPLMFQGSCANVTVAITDNLISMEPILVVGLQ